MTSAELIQFGEQIANLHRRRIEDAPGRGGSPPLCRRQATVERLPDHGGDRCTALPRESANPLVALIVDENLQPVRQHAHTLACATALETGFPVRPGSLIILFHLRVDGGGGGAWRPRRAGWGLGPVLEATLLMAGSGASPCLGGAGRGPGQGQRPPAVAGQVAVGEAQDDGLFFGAQRAGVQAAEERRQSAEGSGPPRSCRTGPGLARESLAGGERWP